MINAMSKGPCDPRVHRHCLAVIVAILVIVVVVVANHCLWTICLSVVIATQYIQCH